VSAPELEVRALAPFERGVLVGAFLDITLDQLVLYVQAAGSDANIPEPLHEPLATAITALGNPDDPGSQLLYLQNMAKMTDTQLLGLVRLVGESPL
jgi:hypothetical protein